MSARVVLASLALELTGCNAVLGLEPSTLEEAPAAQVHEKACTEKCPTGGGCVNGKCVCADGQIDCAGVCTSAQTDANNCGGCGNVCAGTCTAARCLVTLAADDFARYLAVDRTAVYWTNRDGIQKMPLEGGSQVQIAQANDPGAFAIDSENVYFHDLGLIKVPIGGGPATVLVPGHPSYIALDSANVYYVEDVDSSIRKIPINGGTPTVLTSFPPASRILVDATGVYFRDPYGSEIRKVPLAGGASILLADDPNQPRSLALDANSLYWTTWQGGDQDGTLTKLPLDGGDGGAPAILTSMANIDYQDVGLVFDDTSVYFTTDAALMKMPKGGGAITVLVADESVKSLAVDSSNLYFVDGKGVEQLSPK